MNSGGAPVIAIIGAGVAGLSAARQLHEQSNARIIILEKARNAGGRCATRRRSRDPDSEWFDHGAQYFTARDPLFITACANDVKQHQLIAWQPSIGQWQGQQLKSSNDEQLRYVAPRGLNQWLRSKAEQLSADIEIKTQSRVVEINQTSLGWQLRLDNDQLIDANQLLVTAPPEQTQALLEPLALDGLASLKQYQSEACWAVVATGPSLAHDAIFFRQHPALNWAANNLSKQSPHHASLGNNDAIWTLHANPAWSNAQLDASPELAADDLITAFATATQLDPSEFTPLHQHRWRYARPNPAFSPNLPSKHLSLNDAKLAIAGDWLAGGRVEGAWLSGLNAANSLLQNLDS